MLFYGCLCGWQWKQDYRKTVCECVCGTWVSVAEKWQKKKKERGRKWCVREREPDIYVHICDLGLWWLLTKDETLIVMLKAQMDYNREKSTTALLRIVMQGYTVESKYLCECHRQRVTLVNTSDLYSCHLLFLITVAYEGVWFIYNSTDALLISTLCHCIRWGLMCCRWASRWAQSMTTNPLHYISISIILSLKKKDIE